MQSNRRFLFWTASAVATVGLLAAIVVATTVAAGPRYLTQSAYNAKEGIYSAFKDGPVALSATSTTVGVLRPPPGDYLVVAKLWADPTASAGSKMNVFARCLLLAGPPFGPDTDSDISVLNLSKFAVPGNTAAGTLALSLAHRVRKGESIKLMCDDNGSGVQIHHIKINAIRAPSLKFVALP